MILRAPQQAAVVGSQRRVSTGIKRQQAESGHTGISRAQHGAKGRNQGRFAGTSRDERRASASSVIEC